MDQAEDAPIPLLPRARTANPHPESDEGIIDAGAQYVKEIKRHKWIGAIMAAFLGAGSAGGVAYTTSDMAKANEVKVEYLEKVNESLKPRIEKTEGDVRMLNVRFDTVDSSIESLNKSSANIAGGIEELKEVNVRRLEKELEAKEREIRRLERAARDR